MATKELKIYSLSEMKDKYIGEVGTEERDEYEYDLRMDVIGKMIKAARKKAKRSEAAFFNLRSSAKPHLFSMF